MLKNLSAPSPMATWIVLACVLLSGLSLSFLTERYALAANGTPGFPLDDPWIHLQFAKNLHDYGSFSYYKNEMATSGSTSPLYTALLALGFFVTNDEMMLSYVLGVVFLLVGAYFLFRLSLQVFSGNVIYASGAALLMLFEPRLQWVALSGMETTLFICLLLAVAYFHDSRRSIPLGICSGLLLWTRPEAIIFLSVVAADALYNVMVLHQPKRQPAPSTFTSLAWLRAPLMIFIGFALLYAVFNLLLSGSIFPNTMAAKIRYYSSVNPDFPRTVFHYLSDSHWSILFIFAGIGIIATISKLIRRQSPAHLVFLFWPLLLFVAYWKNLPYLYQEGRYMMPVLPFVILLGLLGLRSALEIGGKVVKALNGRSGNAVAALAVLAILFTQFASASWDGRKGYAEYCKYISDRQVRTAHWLQQNLPPDAVVGTHDVGAIAFYSQRRIVDMVGLVSPETIDNIGRLDKLMQFLISKKVTHLVVLRNWFEIDNQNALFRTDERTPEIMEVFPFNPGQTHFVPQNVGRMKAVAASYLAAGNVQQAGQLLDQAVRMDPQSSRAHYYFGKAFLAVGNLERAEGEFKAALQLHPGFSEATTSLAEVAAMQRAAAGGSAQ